MWSPGKLAATTEGSPGALLVSSGNKFYLRDGGRVSQFVPVYFKRAPGARLRVKVTFTTLPMGVAGGHGNRVILRDLGEAPSCGLAYKNKVGLTLHETGCGRGNGNGEPSHETRVTLFQKDRPTTFTVVFDDTGYRVLDSRGEEVIALQKHAPGPYCVFFLKGVKFDPSPEFVVTTELPTTAVAAECGERGERGERAGVRMSDMVPPPFPPHTLSHVASVFKSR
jgi:hypothetical protein